MIRCRWFWKSFHDFLSLTQTSCNSNFCMKHVGKYSPSPPPFIFSLRSGFLFHLNLGVWNFSKPHVFKISMFVFISKRKQIIREVMEGFYLYNFFFTFCFRVIFSLFYTSFQISWHLFFHYFFGFFHLLPHHFSNVLYFNKNSTLFFFVQDLLFVWREKFLLHIQFFYLR